MHVRLANALWHRDPAVQAIMDAVMHAATHVAQHAGRDTHRQRYEVKVQVCDVLDALVCDQLDAARAGDCQTIHDAGHSHLSPSSPQRVYDGDCLQVQDKLIWSQRAADRPTQVIS